MTIIVIESWAFWIFISALYVNACAGLYLAWLKHKANKSEGKS